MTSTTSQPTTARLVKAIVLGDSGVGKSSIVLRFVSNNFKPNMEPTIGAAFMTKTITMNGQAVTYQIWDTAGQERYHSIAPAMYYRGAAAAIFVFDITSEQSFQKLRTWMVELRTHTSGDCAIAIVGNKVDLEKKRAVQKEVGMAYASEVGGLYIETSAKDNINVVDLFSMLYERLPPPSANDKKIVSLSAPTQNRKSNAGCC